MIFLVLLAVGSIFATWHLITTIYSSEQTETSSLEDGEDGVYIVIPSCNDENLGETLPKWLAQKYNNYKVAVVEDCADNGIAETYGLRYVGDLKTSRRIKVYAGEKLLLLVRDGRHGLKGGALNDAIRALIALNPLRNPRYVVFIDSDHEPPDPWFIARAVSAIKRLGADLVQGVQRHLYLGSALDALVSLSHDISGTMLVGRSKLNLMPIFTGSTAIARLEPVTRLWFSEDTVTEDLDLSVRMWLNGYTIAATWSFYTWGRPPRNIKSFFKQQLRWSSGTIRVFTRYFKQVLKSDMPLGRKIDFIFQGTVFATSALYITIVIFIIYKVITGIYFSIYELILMFYLLIVGLTIDLYVEAKHNTPVRPHILPPFIEFATAFVHLAGTLLGLMGREYGWIRTQRKQANVLSHSPSS